MESLAQRAALLWESLQKSQSATDAVVSILGSFDSRLSVLDAAMRPIQVRTHAVRTAHKNIDRTLRSADVILTRFDRTRENVKYRRGHMRSIEHFFSSNRSYRSSDGVLSHVNALLSKALVKMRGEFQSQLSQHSKPMEPDRVFDCLPSTLRPSSGSLSPKVEKTHQLVRIPNISETQRLLYTVLLLLLSQSLFLCSLN